MKAWMIIDPIDGPKLETLKRTEAKSKATISYRGFWPLFESNGYRCVPVRITEIKTKGRK